jgi:hypothetical protein
MDEFETSEETDHDCRRFLGTTAIGIAAAARTFSLSSAGGAFAS